jgi:hypothetical protein
MCQDFVTITRSLSEPGDEANSVSCCPNAEEVSQGLRHAKRVAIVQDELVDKILTTGGEGTKGIKLYILCGQALGRWCVPRPGL